MKQCSVAIYTFLGAGQRSALALLYNINSFYPLTGSMKKILAVLLALFVSNVCVAEKVVVIPLSKLMFRF